LEAEAENLDKQLIAQSAIYRHQHQQAQANWKAVQQSLQPNEAAVELVSFPYYAAHRWTDSVLYAALVIRKNDSLPHYVYLFEEQQLKTILKKQEGELDQTYLNKLYQPSNDGANKLYQLIWQPLAGILKGATTVYAAPTGLLHTLSLGAIPTADSQTIANKYGLQIWSTTADIINKKDVHIDSKSIQQALVFGGINYDIASSKTLDITSPSTNSITANLADDAIRSAAGKWNALDGALQEASAIAQQFRDQKIDTHLYSDSTATETLFKNMPLANNSVLHIATHGFFFKEVTKKNASERAELEDKNQRDFTTAANSLLRSGLIFAGANPSWIDPNYITNANDDGILHSYEIASLNLSKADLVVLSACETGLGDIKGSEGVFGLQRSFKLAGAKNIIMSLWKVPDEKTKELMQAFYQYCFSGKSVSAAFQAAQEMLKNKYPASPYSWAGFTLLQ
jgi:CHAT domain-containing protein